MVDESDFAGLCDWENAMALAMAIAPLIPVPATRHMMRLWWEGSAGEK